MRPELGVWPTLPPQIHLRRPAESLPWPLDAGATVFARARHALWHGVAALGLGPGDVVLAPAYHHGSEIEALARRGLEVRFYDATDDLSPDEGELEGLLDEKVRALHLIHYLGFPQDAGRWRRWCDERGLLLFEDAAQAWLATAAGRPVGSVGDLAIFCLYKTYGIPDGGVLFLKDRSAPGPGPERAAGTMRLLKRHAAWLAERSGVVTALTAPMKRPGTYSIEEDHALGAPGTAPLGASMYALVRAVHEDAAALRRSHFTSLSHRLGPYVPTPFRSTLEGASPFAFPLETMHKRELLRVLEGAGVNALDLWAEPHRLLPIERFPGAGRRRARTLGLPVHQGLRARDLDRIVDAVEAGFAAVLRAPADAAQEIV